MLNWDEIRKEFESSKITLATLAEKHGIKLGTLKSRKSREGWSRGTPKKDATKQPKKDATVKKVATIQPVIENDNLNENQKRFCLEYIKYFNATKAYQKAYGCGYNTARTEGPKTLAKPCIKKEVERLKAEQQQSLFLDSRDILQKYIDIAFADIGDFVQRGDGGYSVTVRPLDEMDTSIISEVSNTENGIKLKLADKMKALEMLSKYFDLLSENDKRSLQEEKLKMDIERTKAEVEKISSGTDDKPIEILIKRKSKGEDS